MSENFADRESVLAYAKKKYKTTPDRPWREYPDNETLRHSDNKKWYALIMPVERGRLGPKAKTDFEAAAAERGEREESEELFDDAFDPDEVVDIMNIKMDDEVLRDILLRQYGFYPAYHMSHSKWMTILLDGTVPFENAANCIDISFEATASKETLQKLRPPKEWLIPANPKYYDVEHAFDEEKVIDWKQSSAVKPGDIIYMYEAAPVSAIVYRCKAVKVDIPFHYRGDDLNIDRLMRIRYERRYRKDEFPYERLKDEFGIRAIRGPRGVPEDLSEALKRPRSGKRNSKRS